MPNGTRRAALACHYGAIAALLVYAGWLVYLARAYFFVFDDFALVGDASTHSASALATTSLFGFFRPAVFLLVKAETLWFGWEHPWGYLLATHAWHLVNAALLWALARRLGLLQPAAIAAASLFALSPWATEATAWASARFDVLCTTGVLTSVLMAVRVAGAGPAGRHWLDVAIGLAGVALAVCSKETGGLTPVLVIAATVAASPRSRWTVASGVYLAGAAAIVVAYLIIRSGLLPDLGGPYGHWGALAVPADLPMNALTYLRSFVALPLPWLAPGAALSPVVAVTTAAMAVVIIAIGAKHRPGAVALALVAVACAIAPTVWLPMQAATTAGGRLLYLPGAWVCLVAGAAISAGLQAGVGRRCASATAAAFLAFAAIAVVSLIHQGRAWTMGYRMSRATIVAFDAMVDRGIEAVFIPDLPFWFAEGPYVLKDYAFGRYYAGRGVPRVRAREMKVTRVGAEAVFAGWVNAEEPAAPAAGERVWMSPAPVAGVPPRLTLSHDAITIVRSGDETGSAEFRIEAPLSAAWLVAASDRDGLLFATARGAGPAVVRVTDQGDNPTGDRVLDVPVFVDGAETPFRHLRVHVRRVDAGDVAPPFGALDLPEHDFVLADTPVMLQGWALDDVDVRRVEVRYAAAGGAEGTLGEATRQGERKDVTARFPAAGDRFRSGWAFGLDPAAVATLPRPFTLIVVAEDRMGRRTEIGRRMVKPVRDTP